MKLFPYLSILLNLFFTSCLENNLMNQEIKKKQVASYFQDKFNKIQQYFEKDTITLSKTMKLIDFDKKVNTPFKETEFFQYSFRGVEPNWKIIIYENKNEKKVLNRGTYAESHIVTDTLITEINKLLKLEKQFSNKEFLSMIKFIFYLKYYRDDGIKIINNWKEISNDSNHIISQVLKRKIKPMKIENINNKLIAEFYCWDIFSSFLYHVSVKYNGNKGIKLLTENIGKFGIPSMAI